MNAEEARVFEIYADCQVKLIRVRLDDEAEEARIFVVTDGKGNTWRYASMIEANKKFMEVSL